ncbi:M15 family metallopeptidase [Streptococcus suis]|nr:M15 family metallopeptidase [Streptococcus suis]
MKIRYLLFPLVFFILIACGKTEEVTPVSTTTAITQPTIQQTTMEESSSNTQTQTSTDSSQTTATTSDQATYNGSYYSVQGKYGEVIIVNKKHPLSSTYAPGENATAQSSFLKLIADMQAQGFAVSYNYSGYRSYETQTDLYQSYVNRDGQANADRYSARAGYSEHQTGLAFDVMDNSGSLLTEPAACQWLAEHAHQYGFVVRYLPEKEAVTGYMAESWHVRYIGQEATEIYHSALTLEEYYGVTGGDY